MQQHLTPVSSQERIQTIDIIRGFALFGIVVVNITVDSGFSPWDGWPGIADQLAYWPVKLFLDDKAMAMFTFLFGLSFAIQMQRAEERKAPFVFIYMRRLLVLAIIGAAHEIFIGRDVLFSYSLIGVLLLLLHKLNRRLLPILALLCILIPWTRNNFLVNKNPNSKLVEIKIDSSLLEKYVGVYTVLSEPKMIITREGNQLFGESQSGKRPWLAESETEFFLRSGNTRQSFIKDSSGNVTGHIMHVNGLHIAGRKTQMDIQQAKKLMAQIRNPKTYSEKVINGARRFWLTNIRYWSWNNYLWGNSIYSILPLFLLGLYAGRRKIFYAISSHRQFLSKTTKWCFLIGMTGVAISQGVAAWDYMNIKNQISYSNLTIALVKLSWDIGIIFMALSFVSGITLMVENIKWKKHFAFLIPVGRMGLTCYLLQSFTIDIAFRSLPDSGTVGTFWRMMIAFLIFTFMIFISRWWFKFFLMGPIEWLWRSLTYLKFQPMRLKASDKNENDKV